jgi:hypothetical protein
MQKAGLGVIAAKKLEKAPAIASAMKIERQVRDTLVDYQ